MAAAVMTPLSAETLKPTTEAQAGLRRPSLTLSPLVLTPPTRENAWPLAPPSTDSPCSGGSRSPALIPIASPALHCPPSSASSGGSSPSMMPLTPASTALGAGRLFWANVSSSQHHDKSVRSPVPWTINTLAPLAPNLSEGKERFSPLPRTPDNLPSPTGPPGGALDGQGVFAKMQDKFLSTTPTTNSSTPELEFGGWGGRRPSAVFNLPGGGLGFRRGSDALLHRRSSEAIGASPLGPNRRSSIVPVPPPSSSSSTDATTPSSAASWARRPSLLATEPMGFGSFGSWERDVVKNQVSEAMEVDVSDHDDVVTTGTETTKAEEGGSKAEQQQQQQTGNGLHLHGMPLPSPTASAMVVVTPPMPTADEDDVGDVLERQAPRDPLDAVRFETMRA